MRSQLEAVVIAGVQNSFSGNLDPKIASPKNVAPIFKEPLAIFVTLKKGDEIRGCMGNLHPKAANLAQEIDQNLKKALFEDPRHRSIQKEEIKGMEVFITAVGDPQPAERIEQLSPERDAVLLRSGSKEAVVLPGEAKTLRYLLALASAKAGIKKGEAYRIFKIPTVTVSFPLPENVLAK